MVDKDALRAKHGGRRVSEDVCLNVSIMRSRKDEIRTSRSVAIVERGYANSRLSLRYMCMTLCVLTSSAARD